MAPFSLLCAFQKPVSVHRGNQLNVAGWAAVADALERVTSLTSLNGCGQYGGIRAGGLRELKLNKEWELPVGVWAARFLERSGATLTVLDLRSQLTDMGNGSCRYNEH